MADYRGVFHARELLHQWIVIIEANRSKTFSFGQSAENIAQREGNSALTRSV